MISLLLFILRIIMYYYYYSMESTIQSYYDYVQSNNNIWIHSYTAVCSVCKDDSFCYCHQATTQQRTCFLCQINLSERAPLLKYIILSEYPFLFSIQRYKKSICIVSLQGRPLRIQLFFQFQRNRHCDFHNSARKNIIFFSEKCP